MRTRSRELLDVEVRDHVSEMVDVKDGSHPSSFRCPLRLGEGGLEMVFDNRAERGRSCSLAEMRGNWSEDISTVKRAADRLQKVFVIRNRPRFMWNLRIDHRENAIVRANEVLPCGFNQDRPACRSHSRVDYGRVYGLGWKVTIGLRNQERALTHLERANLVADVDSGRIRADTRYDALHDANKVVFQAEIRCQRNDGFPHVRLVDWM
jgi:hypothetical protein